MHGAVLLCLFCWCGGRWPSPCLHGKIASSHHSKQNVAATHACCRLWRAMLMDVWQVHAEYPHRYTQCVMNTHSPLWGLNPRPYAYGTYALPAELKRQILENAMFIGVRNWMAQLMLEYMENGRQAAVISNSWHCVFRCKQRFAHFGICKAV